MRPYRRGVRTGVGAKHTTAPLTAAWRGSEPIVESGQEWKPAGELRTLARYIGHGVAITSGGRVRWANERLADLLGVADSLELVGRDLDSLLGDAGVGLPAPGATPVAVSCGLRSASGSREVEVIRGAIEAEGSAADAGKELWVIREAEPQSRLSGELYDVSRSLHDANREVALLRDQLAAEIAEREQLLSVVSHELRTPVTVIRGYNNLLLSDRAGDLNEKQRQFLGESNRSCERLSRFIGDLLSACGEASGNLAPQLRRTSVADLVAGVVSFLRPLLDERALTVDVDLDPTVRFAQCDAERIEQVLTNLLSNAIRHSKPEAHIRVKSEKLEVAGHHFVEVSVADTGPGVASEDHARIFEPYVRASGDQASGGLGLGLAICRRIVTAHGGTIAVFENVGGGSRFAFTLPTEAPAEAG